MAAGAPAILCVPLSFSTLFCSLQVRTATDDGVSDVEGVRLAGHDGELVGAPARHAHHRRLKTVQVVAQAPPGRIGVVLVGACGAQALSVSALPMEVAAALMLGNKANTSGVSSPFTAMQEC